LLTAAAVAQTAGPMAAGVCDDRSIFSGEPLPSCQAVQQAPLYLNPWRPTGWAFYCPEGTYWWGSDYGYSNSYTVESATHEPFCILSAENWFAEGGPSSMPPSTTGAGRISTWS
jgi:hypothetical protein